MNEKATIPVNFSIEHVVATHEEWLRMTQNAQHINIDCSDLRHVGAAGAQLMISLKKSATQLNKTLQFINMPEKITHQLHLLGMRHHFN